jgi:hypothetical protein
MGRPAVTHKAPTENGDTNLVTETSTRGRPKIIPGLQAVGAGFIIPDSVRRIFVNGWKSHVSFTHLTDAYCAYRHSTALPSHDETIVLDPLTDRISMLAKPVADEEEERLTFAEWYQAHIRFLELVNQYFKGDYPFWKAHYEMILTSQTLMEHWQLWLSYDVAIRHRSVALGIDPSVC